MKKNKKKFGGSKKTPYLCTRNQKLGYGVMVTLQILVLPFLVRIRVPQHSESVANYDGLRHLFFCFFLSKICFCR